LFVPAGHCYWREHSRIWEPPILFFSVWFALGLLLSVLAVGRHNHYLFLAYIPVAVGVGYYLERLAVILAGDPIWKWTNYSVIFFCALIFLGGLSGPVVIWHKRSFLTMSIIILSVFTVGFAIAIFYSWKRLGQVGLLTGFTIYPVVINLLLQSLLFPDLNRLKFRRLAEKVGATVAVNPGSRLAIYKHRSLRDFNFYSRLKKIAAVDHRSGLRIFLNPASSHFILIKASDLRELHEISSKSTNVVFEEHIGGERWILLSSCREPCERSSISERALGETPEKLFTPSTRHHEHGNLISGR
jgi:hypothetical protein